MDLQITRREATGEVVLACAGRLDADTGDELARAVAEELRRGHHTLRLDLAETVFLSSAGIRALFDTHRAAQAVGGSCLVRRASGAVRRVLDLTRLTTILVEAVGGGPAPAEARTAACAAAADVIHGPVALIGCVHAPPAPLAATLHGSADAALAGRGVGGAAVRLTRHAFALGIGALADGGDTAGRAGELLAACGTAFHRPPHPHAAVDYVVPAADLLADVSLLAGLTWAGLPAGHAGFEAASDEASLRLDDLIAAILAETPGDAVAVVLAGEIHGLVGAELIRPLPEARDGDSPRAGTRDAAARWLSFSREPVFARHTALVVGVATRDAVTGPLAGFVRPEPGRPFSSHLHALVVPFRPIRRGPVDLAATVADIAASRPIAVLHLLADPQPVLGSGVSQFVRGAVWFAPLTLESAGQA